MHTQEHEIFTVTEKLSRIRPLPRWLCKWKKFSPPYSTAAPSHSTAAPHIWEILISLFQPYSSLKSHLWGLHHSRYKLEAWFPDTRYYRFFFFSLTSIFWASKEGLKFDLITTFTSSLVRPTSRTSGITRKGRIMSFVVRYLQGWKLQWTPRRR